MKILERYLLRAYLASLFWCLTIFIGLYLVLDLLGHLDEILRYHVGWGLVLVYYATMVSLVFIQVAPFACLMATLYTVGNFNRHQEIMAMRASGLSPWAIVRPLLWVGVLMSASVGVVNEVVAPNASLTTSAIKSNYLDRPADPSKPHGVLREIQHLATYGQGHTLLYAKIFDPVEKKMEGVVILQHGPDLRLIRKIAAKEARWTGSKWRFIDGTILHFNEKGATVGKAVPFGTKIIEAGDRPDLLAKSESQAEFMNSRDIYRSMTRLRATGSRIVQKLEVDLYAKSASALACLILTLIGIPFAIQPVRGGTALGLSMGLGVGLAYYGINALMLAVGKGGWLPPLVAALGTPVGYAVFGVKMLWKRLA